MPQIWRPNRSEAVKADVLHGRGGIPATALMERNERQRTQPQRGVSWTSLLMNQALDSVSGSDIRTVMALVSTIHRSGGGSQNLQLGESDEDQDGEGDGNDEEADSESSSGGSRGEGSSSDSEDSEDEGGRRG